MTAEAITYAVVGGPPVDWHGLRVLDADGVEVTHVVEVNSAEGWLIRLKLNSEGRPFAENDRAARERITGKFTIVRPDRAK